MSSHPMARAAARKILADFCLEKAADAQIEALAMGLRVFVKDEALDGAAAILTWRGSAGIVTVDSSIKESGRRRFAIAHELGHFQLHKQRPAFICTDEMFLPWYKSSTFEPEANAFAAELLMPEGPFIKFMKQERPSLNLFGKSVEMFGASLTATCFRYIETDCFPCCLFASVNGRIKWSVKSPSFAHVRTKNPGTLLDDASCAGDYFLNGQIESEGPQDVLADAWIENAAQDQLMVRELPIYMPNYNTVLSLVWSDK